MATTIHTANAPLIKRATGPRPSVMPDLVVAVISQLYASWSWDSRHLERKVRENLSHPGLTLSGVDIYGSVTSPECTERSLPRWPAISRVLSALACGKCWYLSDDIGVTTLL